MVKIIMHGCNGHMGQVISGLVEKDPDAEIVAGIDVADQGKNSYPVYTNMEECQVEADALIDFSSAKATDALLAYCEKRKLPVVLCTTGLSEEQLAKVEETSKNVAVLKSANMSLGVNTLLKLLQDAAKVLAPAGFDMEIVEKHHKHKVDAPSGTAIAMADSINEALGNEYTYTYDRSGRRQERDPKEIGISAVRGGNIVGEHEVIFAGLDEVIEIQTYGIFQSSICQRRGISSQVPERKRPRLLRYERCDQRIKETERKRCTFLVWRFFQRAKEHFYGKRNGTEIPEKPCKALSKCGCGFHGDHQSSVCVESAQRNGAFHDRPPWRI